MGKTNRAPIGEVTGYSRSSIPVPDSAERAASRAGERHRLFGFAWHTINILLIITFFGSAFCIGWEYSVRRYLRGFSDAVVPAQGTPEGKVEAILVWMSNGPTRLPAGPDVAASDRDPTATLNYQALLTVCGTAVNAFINLADSSGLSARRLLLLDKDRRTKHVVAEVLIDGRWIVVDPTFRSIPRAPDGRLLTRTDLASPAVLEAATKNFPRYDASYTYDHTAHIRISRIRLVGGPLRRILNTLAPGWEDSATVSLLVERQSYLAAAVSVLLLLFLLIARAAFRWFGETRLGLRPSRFRDQLRRAAHAFLETAS